MARPALAYSPSRQAGAEHGTHPCRRASGPRWEEPRGPLAALLLVALYPLRMVAFFTERRA